MIITFMQTNQQLFKVQVINRHRLLTDGEGVTTLIGLAGCPLKCKYCINMDILGKQKYRPMSAQELLDKVMIDYCYFLTTGGGLMFGGGESLLHGEAILEFLKIRPMGMKVYMETSMNYESPVLDEVLEQVDYFLIDVKSLDDAIYEQYTGLSPVVMKKNLQRICEKGLQNKCRIRIPIIPGYKTEEQANQEAEIIRTMGFSDVEVFHYILRDYMHVEDLTSAGLVEKTEQQETPVEDEENYTLEEG